MKKIVFFVLIFLMLPVSARIGCYEKGRYEEPQFVECLCDCNNTHPTCMWCGHYHEAPNRQIIISSSNNSDSSNNSCIQTNNRP